MERTKLTFLLLGFPAFPFKGGPSCWIFVSKPMKVACGRVRASEQGRRNEALMKGVSTWIRRSHAPPPSYERSESEREN